MDIDVSEETFEKDPDWERLVEKVSGLGTGSRDVFGPQHKFVGGHMVQQDVHELSCLVMALRTIKRKRYAGGSDGFFADSRLPPAFRYLEVGSASGGTAKLLHEEVGFDQMVSIDLPQGDVCHLKYERFKEFPIHWYEGDSTSYEAVKWLVDKDYGPFDVVFIDGDHHRNGIMRDIGLYRPFVAPGGIMVFHDTVVVNDGFGVRIALDLCYEMGWLEKLVQYRGHINLGIELAEVRGRWVG